MTEIRATQSKAEKLLGFQGDVAMNKKIVVQQNGYLLIKNISSNNPLDLTWRKRFCVIKDGFFLWYNSDSQSGFDRKPKGILPLNSAFTNKRKEDKEGCTFEIVHPDIYQCEFLFRAISAVEADQWIYALENGKKANWENAMLGAAMIQSMQSTGNKKEDEKKKAIQDLQEKVEKLNKATKDKMRILERERKQIENFETQLKNHDDLIGDKLEEAKNIELAIKEEEQIFKESEAKRRMLEQKLSMATMALRRLETSFQLEFASTKADAQFDNVNVQENVNALKSFF
mmetsp:Transcript_10553/g.12002  ORF Transcript_10553/g.12002 Transcript_10553/m.12002 type:complete len:286 (-) Transcript_10553:373-1230(-)